ncbi:hypothetical protein [Neisseria musculi]|uniref:hypothetical protein n=1 Tax=Neisseria musculi TaxID=1815583 RepID=UPI00164B8DE2|nr:hypothetical protein [Neisseria musculi]
MENTIIMNRFVSVADIAVFCRIVCSLPGAENEADSFIEHSGSFILYCSFFCLLLCKPRRAGMLKDSAKAAWLLRGFNKPPNNRLSKNKSVGG